MYLSLNLVFAIDFLFVVHTVVGRWNEKAVSKRKNGVWGLASSKFLEFMYTETSESAPFYIKWKLHSSFILMQKRKSDPST